MSAPGGRPSLVRATLASLLVAAAVLVTVVLPAEFGLDPLGTGQLLGLDGLAGSEPTTVTSEARPFRSDRMRFELAPFESVEYKYRLAPGAAMVFSWRASGEVVFDFHAEPDGAEPGFAESFERGRNRLLEGLGLDET